MNTEKIMSDFIFLIINQGFGAVFLFTLFWLLLFSFVIVSVAFKDLKITGKYYTDVSICVVISFMGVFMHIFATLILLYWFAFLILKIVEEWTN